MRCLCLAPCPPLQHTQCCTLPSAPAWLQVSDALHPCLQSGTSVSLPVTFSWNSWASHVEVTYLLCRMPPLTQQLPAQPRWCTAIHRSACADGPAAGAPLCMSALTRELMVSLPNTLHPHCKPAGLLHWSCLSDKQALPPPRTSRQPAGFVKHYVSVEHVRGREVLHDCSAAAGCRRLSQWQTTCSRA